MRNYSLKDFPACKECDAIAYCNRNPGGALLANITSVVMLVIETVELRR